MNVVDLVLSTLEPLFLTGLMALVALVAPPVFRWFNANADNAFIALLGRLITAVVRQVEQTGAGQSSPVKFSRAFNSITHMLEPQRKRIEKVTGSTVEDFAQTEIESEVLRMNQFKVRPTKGRRGPAKSTST